MFTLNFKVSLLINYFDMKGSDAKSGSENSVSEEKPVRETQPEQQHARTKGEQAGTRRSP